jgi:hypothetical protein
LTAALDAPLTRPELSRRKEETTGIRHHLALALVLSQTLVAPAAGLASDRAPVVVRVTNGGFSWGDAAIGATAGSGLTLLVGVALGPRRKGERRNDSL